MDQLAGLRRPNMDALIEAAAGQELPVRTERYRINRLGVFGQRVDARPSLHVPQSYGGIETGRRQDQIHVGILSAGSRRRPLYRVDFLRVGLQVVDAGVVFHRPYFQGHIVRAGRQQLALGVPLYRVYLVLKESF